MTVTETMAQKSTPELEAKITKYNVKLRNYESFKTQNLVMQQELSEVSMTRIELNKFPEDGTTYKAVGAVMFLVDKGKLLTDLEEREEELKGLIESTSQRVKEFETQLSELRNELETELKSLSPQL